MNFEWQNIAVAIIGTIAFAVALAWVVRRIRSPKSPCDGCSGSCDGCPSNPNNK